MKIIIDAMGGDNAPRVPVEAAARAACELDVNIVLVGKRDIIQSELKRHKYPAGRVEIINADEVITNHEEPAKAVKRKRNSSIVIAARMLKSGDGDAMLSMGNTGAVLAAGTLIVGRIRGIIRPALAAVLPSKTGPKLLLDAGANANCKPENLVQFAVMGSLYMKNIMGISDPSVGLMSIGEEEGKGNNLTKAAYPLIKAAPVNFIGNIEGRDVMEGTADVMTCDGFVGNVILKAIEGMGSFVSGALKSMFTNGIAAKIGAICVMKGLDKFKSEIDYREYGGAPLLGVKGTVIKGHGSSDAKAAFSAIVQAKKAVETDLTEKIKNSLPDTDAKEDME